MSTPSLNPSWTPMVPRVKDLLVNALRSGAYKQAVARMRISKTSPAGLIETHGGVGHCCLGVLTELAVIDGLLDHYSVNERGQCPLMMVKRWAGMSDSVQGILMKMNDGTPTERSVGKPRLNDNRKSFAEIATWIEHNL